MTYLLIIPYQDELLGYRGQSRTAFESELRFLLALKLFELQYLSLDQAAQFCEMNKDRFIYKLGHLQVPIIHLDDDHIIMGCRYRCKRCPKGAWHN